MVQDPKGEDEMTKEQVDWTGLTRTAAGIPEVDVHWVSAQQGAVDRLIDVRESHELVSALGHIEDIEHVPLATVAAASESWDKEASVVVVCRSGGRSGRAAQYLEQQGFKHVVSMAGGMLAWNEVGLPKAEG